ncbi:aromatic ring-hydroxylating oxygenase subunit alpha [Amorphus orientalis]|uniref:Phenylpropionate dioxygenase-like ring-hydroxylating dioxygenase large terminal subunit n=1 Tax=Amorphus orientalis TaxID=649198 RepID=A0AAE3VNZ5_9HYPH|nr:aromatic ring-hydroxylating dioxygenase subunit alpha [Amorphus orientalis]MDQ0315378.1 phenylpropionate dioxygenase-like ring-hydroxylating dioxygenase large terminal subunit [Amorphus orientalis]
MTANTSGRDTVDDYINSGLRGLWVPVAKSVQVKGGKPFGTKIAGENLVLWRDGDGKVHCVEDFCPHRGAKLSLGVVQEGNVACRYHGVAIDGTGTVARVPAMPDCALEGRRPLTSYATAEAADGVFIYLPSADQPEAPEFNPPVEFVSDEWEAFPCMTRWNCSYRLSLDNAADPMHASYLHTDSFTLAYGTKQDTMRLERTDTGFVIERAGQRGVNLDWTEVVVEPGMIYFRLDIPYPNGAGPGGPFRIIGFTAAIDEHTHHSFFWRCRQVQGVEAESWRFLYRAFLEDRHWSVLEQDREMLESIPEDARKREMLYQHDIGVSRLRQMMVRKAKAHLKAQEAAAEQKTA